MDRVEELQAAIANLPPDDYHRIADWFRSRERALWDEQLDRDSIGGKLGLLYSDADAELESAPDLLAQEKPRLRKLFREPHIARRRS
jgi:hypothetical protein